jgi:hypothetical protein
MAMYSHIVSISTNMSCCSFVQQTASMHGAVDEKMNLSYQSQCGLRHDKYIVEKNSNEEAFQIMLGNFACGKKSVLNLFTSVLAKSICLFSDLSSQSRR